MELLSFEQLTKSASALDNIPQAAESNFRTEALIFVLELAVKVRVGQPVVSTAQLLVHRVTPYPVHSLQLLPQCRQTASSSSLSVPFLQDQRANSPSRYSHTGLFRHRTRQTTAQQPSSGPAHSHRSNAVQAE